MTYAKFDDNFAEHPKIASLSDAAFRVHVRGILYANRLLTDGLIPSSVAHPWSRRGVRDLVSAALWTEAPGGYLIHDFLDWNDSAQSVRGKRDAKRMAGAKGAAIRWSHGEDMAQGVESSGEGSGLAVVEPQTPRQGVGESFDRFWATFPKRKGKGAARKAWSAALKKADADTIITAARRYFEDPNLPEPDYIPLPATWLNQERWEDDPESPRSNGQSKHRLDRQYAHLREITNGR